MTVICVTVCVCAFLLVSGYAQCSAMEWRHACLAHAVHRYEVMTLKCEAKFEQLCRMNELLAWPKVLEWETMMTLLRGILWKTLTNTLNSKHGVTHECSRNGYPQKNEMRLPEQIDAKQPDIYLA